MENIKVQNRGITLVALVITIIILLIIAGISISTLGGNNGLFTRARQAKNNTIEAQNAENETIEDYQKKINSIIEGTIKKVSEVKDKVISETKNETVEDEYGNKIVVPAGFKITKDSSNVTQGIVIEDMTEGETKGNQFVWIPVGTVYTNVEKTEYETIKLNRYTFDSEGTPTEKNEEEIIYYTELQESDRGNTVAKSIKNFKTSVTNNHGYYIGRYEAGKNNNVVVCKRGETVWNEVKQIEAATKTREMYNNAKTFTSDLMNSYAWDTAIVFEEKFGTNKKYANKTSNNLDSPIATGESGDVQCNIYDMASNVVEWTTETSSYDGNPCVNRGGDYSNPLGYTASRGGGTTIDTYGAVGFRPTLYL